MTTLEDPFRLPRPIIPAAQMSPRYNTILRSHLAHQKSGTNAQTHTLLTKYSYDQMGRVKSVAKNLDNTTDKTISQNTYNELGQLLTKVFGNSMETQNYSYNIRGWLRAGIVCPASNDQQ